MVVVWIVNVSQKFTFHKFLPLPVLWCSWELLKSKGGWVHWEKAWLLVMILWMLDWYPSLSSSFCSLSGSVSVSLPPVLSPSLHVLPSFLPHSFPFSLPSQLYWREYLDSVTFFSATRYSVLHSQGSQNRKAKQRNRNFSIFEAK